MDTLVEYLLPHELRRLGKDLLNQQMWCWGYDIRRREGNLLSQYGFTKHAAPADSGLKPCYSLRSPDGTVIGLWGFGMYFSSGGAEGLLLKRFAFSPRLVPANEMRFDAWVPVDLPTVRQPGNRAEQDLACELLDASLRWVAGYERWVLAEAGPAHRIAAIDAWRGMRKRIAADALSMPDTWQLLADHLAGSRLHAMSGT